MRILFFIPDFSPGGAQKQCALLFNELSRRAGVNIFLAHIGYGDNYKWIDISFSGNVYKLKNRNYSNPLIAIELNKLYKKIKPDFVMSWLHPADFQCFLLKVFNINVKWIMAERDSSYPALFKYWTRDVIGKLSNKLIANSHKGQNYWIKNRINKNKICVIKNIFIPMNIDVEELCYRNYDVGFIGRFEDQKNIKNTVKLFSELKLLNKNINIYIAGSGSQSDYVKLICLQHSIDYVGYCENVTDLLSKTKIFVSLSYHEGMPNTLIEAVGCGCAIVASNIDEHVDILGRDYPHYYNEHGNTNIILNIILSINNKTWKADCMNQAKKNISKLSPEIIGDDYLYNFKKVVRGIYE